MDTRKIKPLLASTGKKLLVYHSDLDGMCSAALMLRFFGGFELIPREGPMMEDKFVRALAERKPSVMVVLDIPIDQEWRKVELLQKQVPGMRLAVIDHHVPEKDLGKGGNVHMNPRFGGDLYIPASCMVYRLLEELGCDVKPFVWIAAMGVIGDYGIEDCRGLLRECESRYPGSIGKDPMKSRIKDLGDHVMASVILHGQKGVSRSTELLLKAGSYEDIRGNKYFSACGEKVAAELRRILADFEKRKKEHPGLDLIVYRLQSRLNVASTVSTIVAAKHPDKIIIIEKISGGWVKVSARYQAGDISLNALMKETVAGIGSGGGHPKAAGGLVARKDIGEFERRLVSRLTELKGKA